MQRKENETFIDFCERSTLAVETGAIDYKEWSEDIAGCVPYADESLRRCSLFFRHFLSNLMADRAISSSEMGDLQSAKDNLERERMKIHQENLELRESYRQQARAELYKERIVEAIGRLKPIDIKVRNDLNALKVDSTALICLSDFHAGSTFEIKGIYNEVINVYNFDIMQERLWELLRKIEQDDMIYDDITIAILGDCFEGILRPNSLMKLREPVIDTVIKFSEFISNWVVEVQSQLNVPINVVVVGGNHDVQRLLGSKPQFDDENLTKIVVEFMKLRLKDCPDIHVDDYADVSIKNIRGTNVMFEHGQDKDLQETVEYFSNLYNIDVDEIWAGHLHSPESKTIGITEVGDRIVNRVGSICGLDAYSKKIRKAARPSATVAIYTDEGKSWQRQYYL